MITRLPAGMALFSTAVCLSLALSGCQRQAPQRGNATGTPKRPRQGTAAATREVTLAVTGMACPRGCALRVREALATLPGVRQVEVDFEQQQAVVTLDEAAYDEQQLIQALKQAGFAGSVKTSPSGKEQADRPRPGMAAEGAATERYSPPSFADHVRLTAQLDRDTLHPGDTFRLAVVFDIQQGWHIYGNPLGPGIGQKTVISAEAPQGFHFVPARYAAAHKTEQDFGDAGKTWVWGHRGKTIHYLSGTADQSLRPGKYQWMVRAFAQVCDPGHCIPGNAVIPLQVQVVSKEFPSQPINPQLFVGFAEAKTPPYENGS